MKTENTPNEFTKQPFEYYENLRDSVLHAATHWKTDRLWSNHLEQINIICLKLQEANKKEILGDRKIVELEHDKTVLKAELKAKDAMLEKMSESIQALIDNISPIFKTEIEMKKEQIDIFYDFEKWLKKFKKSENDCFWYNNKTLFCREAMFEIYLEQI